MKSFFFFLSLGLFALAFVLCIVDLAICLPQYYFLFLVVIVWVLQAERLFTVQSLIYAEGAD